MTDVFLFRRDLRVHDNTALLKLAAKEDAAVLPLYIFDDAKLGGDYYNPNQLQFLVESLQDLGEQIAGVGGTLYFGKGARVIDVLGDIQERVPGGLRRVAFNAGVTPHAKQRDAEIKEWCQGCGVEVLCCEEDCTILPLDRVKTPTGKLFEVFTPFFRRAMRIPVADPAPLQTRINFATCASFLQENVCVECPKNEALEVGGGRSRGERILLAIKKGQFRSYKKHRDLPWRDATTKLAAYLRFGCLSPREVHAAVKESHGKASVLMENLFLRDFAAVTVHHFPQVLQGQMGQRNGMLHGRYERSKWNDDTEVFERWCSGRTGLPLVDAAMRCLNATGWMHGCLRKLVATFLVHELGVDWRKGEQWFATHLVDYDAACNHLGWAWAMAFRRKMNPYKCAGKYDWQCEFIKKWVPELREVPVLDLITWWESCTKWAGTGYPSVVVPQPGYRVKFKNYIKDYVRPKDPNYKKPTKPSKYAPGKKNLAKYLPKTK
jgi:deoxyribodipyrimidine photo-lyase